MDCVSFTSTDADDAYRKLLDGYRHFHLPDLSNERIHRQIESQKHEIGFNDAKSLRFQEKSPNLDALILVAYVSLLGLYCGATDVLVGLATSDGVVSPFRLQWDDQTTWSHALEAARTAIDKSRDHRVSLSALQRILELKPDQCPFVAFFQASSGSITDASPSAPYLLFHAEDGILSLLSSSDLLSASVAHTLLHQIPALMADAARDTARKLSIPLQMTEDLASAQEELSADDRTSYYSHITPVRIATDFVLPHVNSTPNAIAVQWYPSLWSDTETGLASEHLSYFDLHRSANRFARFLLRRGLRPEDRVAVCLDRNLMFHTIIFGVLRAGGCYVPIDPELPMERKAFIARDSGAKFVVMSSQLYSPTLFGELSVDVDDTSVKGAIASMSDANLDLASPENLAYMLYTSGTTGNPKGCLLTHKGLAEAILALSSFSADVRMDDLREGRYLAVASIAFDVHIAEVFVPLALGMTLVCARRTELLESLPRHISRLEITHVGLVPSLIDATMCTVEEDRVGDEIGLRYIASGGEKISDSILDRWANHPKVRLANFYGPSEVTIGCCARFMDINTPKGSIGRAFANVSSYVVDQNLNILPRGAVGELVVAGPLVGRGYHGRPDLSAKFFLEWPRSGSWAYRTGDLVRMFPDGTLEIIGRIDTQIKLRGVRIEAEGISAVLRKIARNELDLQLDTGTVLASHPAIANGGAPQLVSFVAWDTQVPVATRRSAKPHIVPFVNKLQHALRLGCERELASYMRPAHLIPLSWLPLNSNGKADSKVLDAVFKEIGFDTLVAISQGASEKPTTQTTLSDVQQKLVLLLEKRIRVSPIDIQTNLFAYGMDSLALAQLASDIRRLLHTSVSVADIMKRPTIEALSRLLESPSLPSRESESDSYAVVEKFSAAWHHVVEGAISPLCVERVLPPFPVQEGVLYHADSHPTSCVQHVIMKIPSNIPLSQVRGAWNTAMEKLDVLRTVFHFGKQLVQVILSSVSCQLPWIARSTAIEGDDAFGTFFFAHEASSLAEDINSGTSTTPPFRLTVYTHSQCSRVALSIHHALFDGTSLPLILKFAENELRGRPQASLCSAEPLLEYMLSADTGTARDFWTAKFSDYDWSAHLLMDEQPSGEVRRTTVPFATSISTLNALLAPYQVTIQSVLTYTFASLLGQCIYRSDDVVFGVIRSGRLLPVDGVETALYPTLSVLPTRALLSSDDCLKRTQDDISEAVAYEHYALSQVNKWIRPGHRMFDTLFAMTVKDDTQYDLWEVLRSELPQPDFHLSVEVLLDVRNDALVVRAAHYDHGSLALSVDEILSGFEAGLLDILKGGKPILVSATAVTRDAIPVTPQDADGLGDKSTQGSDVITEDLRPLRAIVSQFLGISLEQLLPGTSFISLGLDSITSVGLSKALRQHGYTVTGADIMKHSSLQKLGALVSRSSDRVAQEEIDQSTLFMSNECERLKASAGRSAYKLSTDDEVDLLPTTALQAGMLSQTVASFGNLYFHVFVLTLDPKTNVSLLQEAWNRAIHQLDILRTTFHYLPDLGVWTQVRHSFAQVIWQDHHLKTSESLQDNIEELISCLRPTDETAFCPPPLHLRVLRAESGNAHLALFMHHALYDGLSIGKLLEHVERLYQDQETACPVQFFDFLPRILLQQHHATSYWARRLQNYRPVTLPHDASCPAKAITASKLISFQQQEIADLVRDAGVTLQCLGQAVWAKVMASLTSSLDIVFGHVVSGRSFNDSEDVVGPMLNTAPFRIRFSSHMSNRDLLRSIHQDNVDALPWQHVSLRAIQSEMHVQNLFSSLFLFQPRTSTTRSKLWTLNDLGEFDAQIQYPLNVEFHEVETGLMVKVACLSDVMDAQTLQGMLTVVEELLEDFIRRPDNQATPALRAPVNADEDLIVDPQHEPEDTFSIPSDLTNIIATAMNCPPEKLHASQSLAAVGIDSITAISLSAKCRKAGLGITVADIVSSQSIGGLVTKIHDRNSGFEAPKPSSSSLEVSSEERQAVLRRFPQESRSQITLVSVATKGMKWLIGAWQRSQRSRFQHVFAYQLSPSVEIERLQKAWEDLLAYHPILRSTFACAPGHAEPRIVTFSAEGLESSLVEERMEEDPDGLTALAARMKGMITSSLPASVPQTRGTILTSSTSRYLLVRMHHFQYDAFSLQLLLDDLSSLYNGKTPRSATDLSSFLSVFAASSSEQKLYWQSVMPTPFVPTYFPSLNRGIFDATSPRRTIVTVKSAIPGATTLEKLAHQHDLSSYALLLACWASTQASYTSSSKVTFGLWHGGRTGPVEDIDKLAIPCMNVLPVHLAVLGDLLQTARALQEDLYKRTPTIQQSDFHSVDDWVTGGKGLPLTNVFVNIFKIARETSQENELFSSVELDYAVPDVPPGFEEAVIDEIPIAQLIQDDVMIDIIINEKLDAITMSVESASAIMDDTHAMEVIKTWASMVEHCLSSA
ncbi:nonribosomal peptide synthetase [Hydnomerulius pinastri MD-312]|nr:nonribosomal peptide synthetase [Hydnomerulius pinastri MD-312]